MKPKPSSPSPLISVCIATYNRKELLAQTLWHIQKQTLSDFEVIVCDDASTDGTYEFLQSLRWPNLHVLRNESNRNHCGTYTRLFSEARGKYIGMQHDHDLYEPKFLESMVALMERHPTAGFACSAYHVFDGSRLILNPSIVESDLFPESELVAGSSILKILASQPSTPIAAMGTVFRRSVVEAVGGYRPDWYIASDEDLYSRVATVSDFAFCHQRLFIMRTRPDDRKPVLGSWRSLYTLHEFRSDLEERLIPGSWLFKAFRLFRLRVLRDLALIKESVHLWIHGDELRLADALNFHLFPTLPLGNDFLNPLEKWGFRLWIVGLRKTIAVGSWIGAFRRKQKLPIRSARQKA